MGSDADGGDADLRAPLLPTTTAEGDVESRHRPAGEAGGDAATAGSAGWRRLRRDLRVTREGVYLAPSTGERPTSSTGVPLMRVPSLYATLHEDEDAHAGFEQAGRLRLATEYVRDAMDGGGRSRVPTRAYLLLFSRRKLLHVTLSPAPPPFVRSRSD
jgi:hypothetical protein